MYLLCLLVEYIITKIFCLAVIEAGLHEAKLNFLFFAF